MHKSVFILSLPDNPIIEALSDLTLDSVILGNNLATNENINSLKNKLNKVKIYAELPVFSQKDLAEEYPDSIPVDSLGNKLNFSDCHFLCPSHEEVRNEILNKTKNLTTSGVDGIWLNFIRYATSWQFPDPKILDTCYCDRCLNKFEEYIGEKLCFKDYEELYLLIDGSYYFEWLEFKSEQITSIISEILEITSKNNSSIELGAFIVPWMEKDFGAGIKRIVAQDVEKMSKYIQMFSPMLYHKMLGKDVEWVKEMTDYYWQSGVNFLPLVQTEPKVSEISPEEFKLAINYATSGVSKGVCIYFFEDLVMNRPKLFDIVKSTFAS